VPVSAPLAVSVPSTPRPDKQGSPAFAPLTPSPLTPSPPMPRLQVLPPAAADAAPTVLSPRPTVPPLDMAPTSPFDAATLVAAEQLLRPVLGPLAALVVRRAAARWRSVPALVALLAHEPMAAEERREFLARAQRAFGAPPVPSPLALPVLVDTPLADDAVQRAERALVRQIGPIAKLMVRHARAQSTSREAFIVALADAAADCVDRERVLEELQRAV
jgi:serine/threonine-protein kinase